VDKRISLKRAALWGACFGLFAIAARHLIGGGPQALYSTEAILQALVAEPIGAMIGGVIMFVGSAAIMNTVRR